MLNPLPALFIKYQAKKVRRRQGLVAGKEQAPAFNEVELHNICFLHLLKVFQSGQHLSFHPGRPILVGDGPRLAAINWRALPWVPYPHPSTTTSSIYHWDEGWEENLGAPSNLES